MKDELFSDSISDIAVTGNLVRIDFVSMAEPSTDGKPTYEKRYRMIMPIEGFLRSFSIAEEMMHRLIASGLIKKQGTDRYNKEQLGSEPADRIVESPKSPNFN